MCALDPLIAAAPMLPHVTTQIVEGIRSMSKAVLIALAAVALTGCIPKADADSPVNANPESSPAYNRVAGSLVKTCDNGRAIYVYEGYREASIAIVDDAAECRGK